MKEQHYFYTPQMNGELPEEEARHALRVLRLSVGDSLCLMDGRGNFYEAVITSSTGHRCLYRLTATHPQTPLWKGNIHLAMAPTKLMDRTEWFVEKATEIGLDGVSFLDCDNSERRQIKTDRIERIVVAAMKQSRKAFKPEVTDMTPFDRFVTQPRTGQCFICHCHDDIPQDPADARCHLMEAMQKGMPATVLIGPEGDFSMREVELALAGGYRSVHLGHSRLRTETAALVAVHCMQLLNQCPDGLTQTSLQI